MRPATAQPDQREAAIGLIEVLVVVLIILVLVAIGFGAIKSSQSAGRLITTIAAAQDYAGAVDRFRRDHNGRYPNPPGSTDWPGGAAAKQGPRSAALGTSTYLRRVPEAVQGGVVVIGARGGAPAGIVYRRSGSGYEIIVDVLNRPPCALRGGGATGTTPPTCSKR